MRRCLPALLGTLLVTPVGAQISARLTAGATTGTPLVEDILGGPVSLSAGVTPTVALAVSHPIGGGYRAIAEARVARGGLKIDDDGVDDDLGTLTTIAALLLVDGPLAGSFRWEAGAGIISYRPADRIGVFADGGPSPWMLGAGLSWSRSIGSGAQLVAGARYDFHQFRTRQLESRGYTQYQTVHRLGIGLGLERAF